MFVLLVLLIIPFAILSEMLKMNKLNHRAAPGAIPAAVL